MISIIRTILVTSAIITSFLRYDAHLSLEKSFPMLPWTGVSNKRTAKPARLAGPILYHNMTRTAVACSGPIHRKCRNNVVCKQKRTCMSYIYYSVTQQKISVHLVKPVDIIRHEVHYVADCGLSK